MDFKNIIDKAAKIGKEVVWDFSQKVDVLTMFDYIKQSKNIALVGHDKIDWDSFWSTMALKYWIENKFPDKKVTAYTNRKYPSVFEFLNPDILYGENLKLDENTDLIITLDSANLSRLWDFYENNKDKFEKNTIINIDHHISNNKFWTINLVDWNSPATAQFLYEILKFLDTNITNIVWWLKKWIDKKVANYLLLGILTDTQVFMIPLANDKTLKIAAELIQQGADKQLLINKIFLSKSLWELKLQWLVLDRIKYIEDNDIKAYWSYYTNDDILSLWLDPEDSWLGRNLPSILMQIDDADFVALWKIKDDETTVSFRSKEFDVNQIAAKLWWWGHKNAAWAKFEKKLTPEEINEIMKDILKKEND